MRTEFGSYLYDNRARKNVSLRQFAISAGLDPAYYSRIERGEIPPPSEKVLTKIAEAMGISPGWSDEWKHLCYLADTARGKLPEFIRNDAEIASLLPAFYAKLREQRPGTSEEMYKMYLEIVRGDFEPNYWDERSE